MSMKQKHNYIDENISKWTLSFTKEEDRQNYQERMQNTMIIPVAFKIGAFGIIIIAISYRIVATILAGRSDLIKTGSFTQELSLCLFTIIAIVIEIILRYTGRLKAVHGFFLYIMYPLTSITAAFFTNKAPLFGVT